jgi:hypothetical protein
MGKKSYWGMTFGRLSRGEQESDLIPFLSNLQTNISDWWPI